MNNERREFVRYPIKPYMIFLYSNYSPVKGWVKDISKGGMSFEYTPVEECEPKSEISVILTGDNFPFYLPDLVCKTIYNIETVNNNGSSKRLGLQRYGVKFEIVDATMQKKLTSLFTSEAIM